MAGLAAGALLLAASCSTSAAVDESVVVQVLMADDWATAPAVGAVVDEFERDHPDVRIQLQGSPFSRIPELVEAANDLDQPYDLVHWHAFAAASAGLAMPIDDRWSGAGLTADEYLDGALAGVTWNGHRYGIPLDVNALVLLVNGDVMDAAGISVEQLRTVEGFREVADRLVSSGAVDYALPVTASSWAAYGWIVAHGGELVELDTATGEARFTFDAPGTIAALELLESLVDTELAPPPFAPDVAMDAIQAFAEGRVAMYATGSWDLPAARQAVYGDDAPDVVVVPLPQRDPAHPRTVLGGSSLFIPPDAEHPDLAFELALRLTEDETALRLAVEEGRLPARVRVYGDEMFRSSPQVAAFVDQLPHAQVMPLIAWPEVSEAFREALERILSGRASTADALVELQEFADQASGATEAIAP